MLRLAKRGRLVIVAPHPDDETLGCGALITSAVRYGVPVGVIALTDGDASHPSSQRWPPAALGRLRSGEQRRALARLGAGDAPVRRFGWGDGRVTGDAGGCRLSRQLVALRAGVVLVTSDADHHPDHQAASRLAQVAARHLSLPLVHYAVWSRVDAPQRGSTCYRLKKSWAMAAHRSQVAGYIADDPAGFRLSPAALASLISGPEQFFLQDQASGSSGRPTRVSMSLPHATISAASGRLPSTTAPLALSKPETKTWINVRFGKPG